jgi:hypothetical protein
MVSVPKRGARENETIPMGDLVIRHRNFHAGESVLIDGLL